MDTPSKVELCRHGKGDLALLAALVGDERLMRDLGGAMPESAIREMHERYLAAEPESGGYFVITADGVPVGTIGFAAARSGDAEAFEAGWAVLPEYQGRGVAAAALRILIDEAASRGGRRYLDAFSSVDNAASNALCRRVGFVHMGEQVVEFPEGCPRRCIHWRYDLTAVDPRSA